jgi:beta-phosphoglucomutase
MTELLAFVFDLDGVITDTAEFHFRAWKRLAEEEELPFTREDNEALRGVSRRQSLLLLLKGKVIPEVQMEAWMTRKNDYYRAFLKDISPNDLLPGVGDFLREAKSRGLKLGLASASKNAREVMQGLGIIDLMDAIGDGYSVSNPKPAPDLFVWVAGRLGVYPSQTVIFEDAEAGVDAALAAGMFAVGLGPQERVGKGHLVLPSLEHANVDNILTTLGTTR